MRDELDELLDRYAPEAGELWLSALPDPAPEHEFSPKFRRKVEKLLRRQRRSPAVNAALRYGRRAAAFALVFLTLSFSCLMTVNAAFRERVIQAVVQVFQDFTEFVYTSDSSAVGKPGNLVFTYLPEGMEERLRAAVESRRTAPRRFRRLGRLSAPCLFQQFLKCHAKWICHT